MLVIITSVPHRVIVYLNVVYPTETHDSAHVDDGTGQVVGGEELDDGYNIHILPLINPCQSRRPCVRRIESQRQGIKLRRCSKCGEEGHYRSTYRNPRADFNVGHKGDLVHLEDSLGGDATSPW